MKADEADEGDEELQLPPPTTAEERRAINRDLFAKALLYIDPLAVKIPNVLEALHRRALPDSWKTGNLSPVAQLRIVSAALATALKCNVEALPRLSPSTRILRPRGRYSDVAFVLYFNDKISKNKLCALLRRGKIPYAEDVKPHMVTVESTGWGIYSTPMSINTWLDENNVREMFHVPGFFSAAKC